METETARFFEKPKRLVFNRLGEEGHRGNMPICRYWLQGRCNKNPCKFLHPNSGQPQPQPQPQRQLKRPHVVSDDRGGDKFKSTLKNPHPSSKISDELGGNKFKTTWINPKLSSKIARAHTEGVNSEGKIVHVMKKQELIKGDSVSVDVIPEKVQKQLMKGDSPSIEVTPQEAQEKKLCQYWVTGNCVYGENCRDLHSWFTGSGLSLVTKLERHKKAVTGIALPSGSDKLFSGSKDGSFCIWDCNSGQCINSVNLGSEIGCVTSEGPWIFIGLQNTLKACNVETQTELCLSGANGLVHSVVGAVDMVFGAVEDGSILVWKCTPESSEPVVVATLQGHKQAVLSLFVGANRLYSGSKDGTIRVWDVETLQCLHTLEGHSGPVTSVICWDLYLISGSLDNTLKVWALAESGKLEVIFEFGKESGILALRGIHDTEANPILLCSLTDETVRIYHLPPFTERGRIFAKGVISLETMEKGSLFFTGDVAGQLCVWKLNAAQPS